MSDPVDPIGGNDRVRHFRRRATDLRLDPAPEGDAPQANVPGETLPVPVGEVQKVRFDPRNDRRRSGFAAFAAHLLGQAGQKRGLKAGSEALYNAQTSYLGVEWSGPSDRRTRKGASQKTEI
jgi:hypothetical protein